MPGSREDQYRRSRNAQILALLFSCMFFAAIAYGWFNLFLKFGTFIALVLGALGAITAWYLARELGEDRSNRVLYVPLIAISALGVYNSMMLYFEGQRLLTDTVTQAQANFTSLQNAAQSALSASGATTHLAHVQSLSDSLFSEIRNPLNCGQGSHAHELIGELQKELPGFTELSATGNSCKHDEEVIGDYKDRIAALVERAKWNDPALQAIDSQAGKAREALEVARGELVGDYSPTRLPHIITGLEAQDSTYRDLRYQLSRRADVKELPPGLPLTGAQSLGNISQVPALIWSRRGEWSTYVYLGAAVGFDLFMVYLFGMVAGSRVRRDYGPRTVAGAL